MTVRRVDVGKRAKITACEPGPDPDLEWVDVASLQIDEAYQRPVNWKSVERIAKDFRWSRFQPVVVARMPDGTLDLIDGQHRAHAAWLCRLPRVPAMVVDLRFSERASAFSWINGQVTKMTPFHIYKAAIAAGESWAVEARDAVAEAGCVLMTANKSSYEKRPGEIFAHSLIRSYLNAGEREVVVTGLEALRRCDEAETPQLWVRDILRAWLSALSSCAPFLKLDLVAALEGISLCELDDEASARARTPEMRVKKATRHALLRAAIVEHLQAYRAAGKGAA